MCSTEVLTRFAIEPGASPHTFDASSERIDVYGSTVRKKPTIVHANTIIGTRSKKSERSRLGPSFITGRISMPIDVANMDLWLPRILGGTESADSFPVAETLPAFGMLEDLVGQTHEFKDCYVAQAIISGRAWNGQSAPQALMLTLDIIGISEATGTSFPAASLSTAANTAPLLFEDGSFTIQSAARDVIDFYILINNKLVPRWTNSLVPTCIYSAGRDVQMRVTTPYTSALSSALYAQTYTGAAATITFTNGNTSFGFTFGRYQAVTPTPVVQGRGEVTLDLEGFATSVTTTKEIVGANDSTV